MKQRTRVRGDGVRVRERLHVEREWRQEEVECVVCGTYFESRHTNATTCSAACRQALYRDRQAG